MMLYLPYMCRYVYVLNFYYARKDVYVFMLIHNAININSLEIWSRDMGIYLSTPKTEKVSEDGENDKLRYGLSSMQGWRSTMEDAVSIFWYLIFLSQARFLFKFHCPSYLCQNYILCCTADHNYGMEMILLVLFE